MCGIVGFIGKNKNIDTLNDMLEIQSYRGPDDSGVYFDEKSGVHLGHNRLSIQDLTSHGHQPFISDCGNYIIVFNGEVYNFKNIKIELEKLGYKFISNSDTEVILYSYKQWGIDCIDKFIGMFAFAILDKVEDKLFLVRDRAGVKPLYYYKVGNQFMFSSEIKSFHKHPIFRKEQNLSVLPYFFQFGYIPAPYTIFKNCFKLEAGHYLELKIDNLEFEITKYWDVNDFYLQEKFTKSENEILEDIEKIVYNAIDLRMVSDVPVGVFLSGGYDSSLVASILAKKQGKKINTFTIGFDDEKYNEAEHAKTIAEYLGTNHTEYYMKNSDMLDLVEKLPFYYDEPFGDSSALPTMIVSKLARQNVTVALSADGGDELFWGYNNYFRMAKVRKLYDLPKFIRSSASFLLNKSSNYRFKKIADGLNIDNLEELFLYSGRLFDFEKLFNQKNILCQDEYKKYLYSQKDFFERMSDYDIKTYMNGDIFTKVDRATMAYSLEARTPFVDYRVVEFSQKIPFKYKYENGSGKNILKDILYDYLPREIFDRPKSGFTVPLKNWFRNELKDYVYETLSEKNLQKIDDIDISYAKQMIENHMNGKENNYHQIWTLISYIKWMEKYYEK